MNSDRNIDRFESSCVTRDLFHDGAFEVLQFKDRGHRSGMDALLLAASVPEDANGIVLDLGSGVGVAGLAAININPNLRLISLEADSGLCKLAKQSLLLERNNHLRGRVEIINGNVAARGQERTNLGMLPNSVDHVIMNPPYNKSNHRKSLDFIKVMAHTLDDDSIESWFRTAAAVLRPGGSFSIIYRIENLVDILTFAAGRFGRLNFIPIHSRQGQPAKRLIGCGIKGSKTKLSLHPGFVLHEADGSFTPQACKIFKGNARLEY